VWRISGQALMIAADAKGNNHACQVDRRIGFARARRALPNDPDSGAG
jgi:hypothetical protein